MTVFYTGDVAKQEKQLNKTARNLSKEKAQHNTHVSLLFIPNCTNLAVGNEAL